MESRVPIPTDNIYKFYALCGLFAFVATMLAVVYVNQSTNAFLSKAMVEVEELSTKENLSPAEKVKLDIQKRLIEVAVEDKKTFTIGLSMVLAITIISMVFGFKHWHFHIQPKQDRLLDLQIQKAEQELKGATRKPFRASKK